MHTLVITLTDGHVIWSAMTLAYFGRLRASEFTIQGKFNTSIHLSVSDVTVFQNQALPYVSVIINRSKTHKFNKDVTIYIGCTSDPDIEPQFKTLFFRRPPARTCTCLSPQSQ